MQPDAHTQGLDILQALQNILAELPGTLPEHQKRLNSIQFLRERLVRLHELETATSSETSEE